MSDSDFRISTRTPVNSLASDPFSFRTHLRSLPPLRLPFTFIAGPRRGAGVMGGCSSAVLVRAPIAGSTPVYRVVDETRKTPAAAAANVAVTAAVTAAVGVAGASQSEGQRFVPALEPDGAVAHYSAVVRWVFAGNDPTAFDYETGDWKHLPWPPNRRGSDYAARWPMPMCPSRAASPQRPRTRLPPPRRRQRS
jgi:hypothetical protein